MFKATDTWLDFLGRNAETCPVPCKKMAVFFGFPFFSSTESCGKKTSGKVSMYLKKMIKLSQDHNSYSFLRYLKLVCIIYFV